MATVVAIALSGGDPVIAAMPAATAFVVWALCRVPLRWFAVGLIALLLSLDRSSDAGGAWHSPLVLLGDLLNYNVDGVFPAAKGIKLNGMELLLFGMLIVAAARRYLQHDNVDARGRVPIARMVRALVVLYLASIAYATINGLATGGTADIAILQMRPLIDTALCFLAFDLAFRGPRDHRLLGRLIVFCACIKAALAIYVGYVVLPTLARNPEYSTNHGDSILFALACTILVAHLMERTDRVRLAHCGLILPLLLLGMLANNRRLVWVALGFGLGAAFLLVPRTRIWKRRLTRRLIYAAPVLLIYLGVGWSIRSTVTTPVRIIRSVVDHKSDRSSWNRQLENWNLARSMWARPIAGLGFGHEWTEHYRQDELLSVFPLYHAEPHNMVLGLLLFMGILGFTGLWALPTGSMFLAIRSYRWAREPEDRAAALCCIACILVLGAESFGDLGPFWTQFKVCGALAFVVAGKLATATGALRPPPTRGAVRHNRLAPPPGIGVSTRPRSYSPAFHGREADDPRPSSAPSIME